MVNPAETATTIKADVLVIGAGPAGSAAALVLARSGLDVVLADRADFPRDKVCGDALIPDALAALDTLGLLHRVLAEAQPLHEVRLYSPGGREVRLRGTSAVLPRRLFDDILRRAAIEAGARFLSPLRATGPILQHSRYAGAILQHVPDGPRIAIQARWTILATGAAAAALRSFGVCERLDASGTAARLYLEVPAPLAADLRFLALCSQRQFAPGYGWIFPAGASMVAAPPSTAPLHVFNVGVGVFHDVRRGTRMQNLRELLARFLEAFEPAQTVSRAAVSRTRFLGAPLRTALVGAAFARPGLLVAGEAAGTTYSFSGEGIGKALETGRLAAETIVKALRRSADAHETAAEYAAAVERAYRDRFRAYKLAQGCLAYPVVADLIARRANGGRFVRRQLEGLFNETTSPKTLFSASGFIRGLLS